MRSFRWLSIATAQADPAVHGNGPTVGHLALADAIRRAYRVSMPPRDDTDLALRADWLLEHGCADPVLTNGPFAQSWRTAAAMRILTRRPELARHDIHTATVCGELDRVKELLTVRADAATTRGGPVRWRENPAHASQWTPLLHLCYGRLPIRRAADNAVLIAEALLDGGGDPNAYFEVGSHPSRYTCLTGLIGGGEEGVAPHPRADRLIPLFLEHGANPLDIQFIYNTSFDGGVFRWLDLLYAKSTASGRQSDWTEPRWNPALSLSAFDWLLRIATDQRDTARMQWLVERGARSMATPPRSGNPDPERLFTDACLSANYEEAIGILNAHPAFRHSHVTLFAAAERNRADVVTFLLDQGVSVEEMDSSKQRALHVAVSHNAFETVELLIARGADTEAKESGWNNTPLDHAIYGNQTRMIELLTNHSRDLCKVARMGNVTRLRHLIRESSKSGDDEEITSALLCLPDDEAKAVEIVMLLLTAGASPRVVNTRGETAAFQAEKRGLEAAAAALREAEARVP